MSKESAKSKATVQTGSNWNRNGNSCKLTGAAAIRVKLSRPMQAHNLQLCHYVQPLRLEDPWPSQWRAAPSPASAMGNLHKIPDWRLMQISSCWIWEARPKPFQNLFKDSSQDSPRGKMFSCSMVSQILFIWSSLRAPPMRRFFCTWSPKWKTAEAILGRAAQSQVPEQVSWLSHGGFARPNRLGWLGLSHSLSK